MRWSKFPEYSKLTPSQGLANGYSNIKTKPEFYLEDILEADLQMTEFK